MNLLQKRELLNKIKDEIIKVQDEPESDKKTKNIRRIIADLLNLSIRGWKAAGTA